MNKTTNIWREVLKREFEHEVMQHAVKTVFSCENSDELLHEFYDVFRRAQVTFEAKIPIIENRFLNTYKRRPKSKSSMMASFNAYILTEHFARRCAEEMYDLYRTETNGKKHDVNVIISIFNGSGIDSTCSPIKRRKTKI